MEGRNTYLGSRGAESQKIRNQHKMRRSSSRARQPAKCVPSHRLPAFLGALLLASSAMNSAGDGKTNSVLVSATVSSSSMSFFGKRSSSKTNIGTAAAAASSITTATQTPPRGGAASTSASFAGLDADTLRSLGVDESEIGDLFLDETDGEFAALGASSRRQQRVMERNPVVAEEEEENEYEWESDDDDEDGMESAEEEYDSEEEEPDAPADAFDQEYDFEEYEEYEDDDEDVGEEWWRNPLGRYQDGADEYDKVEAESDYDDASSSLEELLGEAEDDEEEKRAQVVQRQGGRSPAKKKSAKGRSTKGRSTQGQAAIHWSPHLWRKEESRQTLVGGGETEEFQRQVFRSDHIFVLLERSHPAWQCQGPAAGGCRARTSDYSRWVTFGQNVADRPNHSLAWTRQLLAWPCSIDASPGFDRGGCRSGISAVQ